MRSTAVLLAIIGSIALYPEVVLGREVPVYVYRAQPTMTPTSSPSISLQPSLRPSLSYETKQEILLSKLAAIQDEENSQASAPPLSFAWILALALTLVAFVGVLYKLKKRRRRIDEATHAAQAPAKESKKASSDAGHLDLFDATSMSTSKDEETDGWSSWMPWTKNNEEVKS